MLIASVWPEVNRNASELSILRRSVRTLFTSAKMSQGMSLRISGMVCIVARRQGAQRARSPVICVPCDCLCDLVCLFLFF